MPAKKLLLFFSVTTALNFCGLLSAGSENSGDNPTELPEQPEPPSGYTPKPGWPTTSFSVATAHPLATEAGYQILRASGSAVDAAIAVQLVLGLVEPQASGIGGGAFALVWNGEEVMAYNGRETAPAAADENLFLDHRGEALAFSRAVRSGAAVGVPGTLALLKAIHDEHGVLPWEQLFAAAITLAEDGVIISERLHRSLQSESALQRDSIASDHFFADDGQPHPVGHRLKNPAYAEILRNIAQYGINAFYQGPVAADIVKRVKTHRRPGGIELTDIASYANRDLNTAPLCSVWRKYKIYGFPPPSSGHITIMQILYILDHLQAVETPLKDGIPAPDWLHHFLEAAKLAFADRNHYIADPDFSNPPAGDWQSLLKADYLARRANLITAQSMGRADPGKPAGMNSNYGIPIQQPESGTSHISIVDPQGNAISMTTTLESGFGSRIMSDGGTGLKGGFLLNNQLTDFSLSPIDENGKVIANRVEAGKQPRSSMSPTLVFDNESGEFLATLGSPGGAAIIHYTAKALIAMFDWRLNAQEAIDLPNFANYNGPSVLEQGRFPKEWIESLEAIGHELKSSPLTSGLQAIQKTATGYYGGADPRREGNVMGD